MSLQYHYTWYDVIQGGIQILQTSCKVPMAKMDSKLPYHLSLPVVLMFGFSVRVTASKVLAVWYIA